MRSLLGRFHRPFARSADEQLLLMNNLGDGSTLSLDFTTMGNTLDPRLTFTRGSNATFINSSGLMQYAFSNRIPNSASLSGFTANGVTATADATEPGPVVAPSGTQATKVTVNGGATTVNFSRNFGTGAGTATGMTYSIYLKPSRLNNGSGFRYAIRNETTGSNTYGVDVVWANSPVTVNEVIGAADGDYQLSGPDANGWYRLILRVTNTGLIRPGDNLTVYAGYSGQGTGFFDASGAYWVWGAQLEPGLTASPVYLTGATSTGYFDVPRFDYDPTTIGSPRGLLIEGSANNLSLDSENFSAWSTANTSLSSESGDTNPDGITVPTRVSDDSTNAEHNRTRSPSLTTATTYTKSVWFKNPATNGRRYGGLQLFAGGGTDAGGVVAVWDFDTGQTVTALTYGYGGKPTPSVSCVPYKSGWYRVSISMTVTGTLTSLNHRIVLSNGIATSYANSGTALGLLVWGAQLEAGSGASSYIPTGASQGSRSADECYTDSMAWFSAGQPYSMLFRYSMNNPTAWAGTNIDRAVGQLSVGSAGNRTFMYAAYRVASGSSDIGRYVRVFDTNTLDMFPATLPAAVSNTSMAFAVDANDSAISASNDVLGTDASNTILSGQNRLHIGSIGTAQQMNGCISSVKYWPLRLPNATLQALTT